MSGKKVQNSEDVTFLILMPQKIETFLFKNWRLFLTKVKIMIMIGEGKRGGASG